MFQFRINDQVYLKYHGLDRYIIVEQHCHPKTGLREVCVVDAVTQTEKHWVKESTCYVDRCLSIENAKRHFENVKLIKDKVTEYGKQNHRT
jgi:hypothetical protein